MASLSDKLLLERMAQGDGASFEALFHRHYEQVYGLLFRLVGNRGEAEDLAQEVFLKFYHQSFRLDREHNVGGWLYRVATNLGYNALRERKRRWQRNVLLLPDPAGAPDPADEVAANERMARVRAALARLPQRQVQMLLLRQMELSYAEIAESCGVAPGSVGTMLARAATAFRQAYEALDE